MACTNPTLQHDGEVMVLAGADVTLIQEKAKFALLPKKLEKPMPERNGPTEVIPFIGPCCRTG